MEASTCSDIRSGDEEREREREVKDMDHGWQNHVPVELPAFFVGEEPGK